MIASSSLSLSEIETLAAVAASRDLKTEELKYFANNADRCNSLRAGPESLMSSSSRLPHQRQRVQAAALTCRGKVGLTDTFWNRVSSARTVALPSGETRSVRRD